MSQKVPARRAIAIVLSLLLATLAVTMLAGAPASAHEERPARFPDGTGHRPSFLGYDNPRHRVVCTRGSKERIASLHGAAKTRSQRLLRQCRFRSIQSAIDSIEHRNTSIYVLPGRYTEHKVATSRPSRYCSNLSTSSKDPLVKTNYIGTLTGGANAPTGAQSPDNTAPLIAISYPDQVRCPHNLNLISIFGDRSLHNKSMHCDSRFCGTQLVGTGGRPRNVVIDNRFQKLNAIRADRAGGVFLENFTVQQAEFNAVYVMETDGFVIDRVVARANDEYGILAFASDHGLIQGINAYYNGDSGIYPGSASDINGDNERFKVKRFSVEIRRSRSHDNTLGYSGTAGNSVYAHNNWFFDNATGIATDSLFPGHPGLPQDHAHWSHNRIYSNNSNYYVRNVDTGICDKPISERGYMQGTVCPTVPVPVGTGVLIAGGNFNSIDHNFIYDNWRFGTMQFWVPASLRDDYDPAHQYDTSHHNHTVDNTMGITPGGRVRPNGLDHWWDEEGTGNCWQNNTSSYGTPTTNWTIPVPSCADGGSVYVVGTPVRDAGFLTCSQYNRDDPNWQHPPECDWFDSPSKPGTSTSAVPQDLTTQTGGPSGFDPTTPLGALIVAVLVACGLCAPRLRSLARSQP